MGQEYRITACVAEKQPLRDISICQICDLCVHLYVYNLSAKFHMCIHFLFAVADVLRLACQVLMPIFIAFFPPRCAPVPRFTFSPPVAGWQAPPVPPQPVSVAAWPAWASLSTPRQRIAWHRRVECRSPAPAPLSPLFAMPCAAQLDSAIEDCILHCTDAASPSLHRNARRIAAWQRNAMHSALFTGPRQ